MLGKDVRSRDAYKTLYLRLLLVLTKNTPNNPQVISSLWRDLCGRTPCSKPMLVMGRLCMLTGLALSYMTVPEPTTAGWDVILLWTQLQVSESFQDEMFTLSWPVWMLQT